MKYITVLFALAGTALFAAEPVRVSVADFGAEAGSGKDCVAAVARALEACKAHESSVLVFPKGRYDFHAPEGGRRIVGLAVAGQKNLTVDGGGSAFVFHGILGVGALNDSQNVTLRNFSVDWDRPMIAQGIILDTADDHLDVKFDKAAHPFEIADGKIFFLGEGWRRQVDGYTLLFDKTTRELAYATRDSTIGDNALFNTRSEEVADGVVRFHGKPRHKAEPGTFIALWLGRYVANVFDVARCKDVVMEDITVYHGLGNCIVGFRTENITLRNFNIRANEAKGRVFSIIADGFHVNTCKGLLKIENCEHTGMGDDFLNLHGMNVMVLERVDDYTVKVGASGKGGASYVLGVGDEVWFIDGQTTQRGATGIIKEIKDVLGAGRPVAKHIVFEQKIPDSVKAKDALENKTWNAELEIRDCRILRAHRARGLLVSTPRRAVIENNYFRTAGAAILVEGDVNYWYESGAVNDLVIRNNVFEDCFSSGYAGDWGHAVITIHPSFQPKSDADEAYHRNIRIENNVFKSFDYPILFARSVRNLTFTGNTLSKTTTFPPFAQNKTTFVLDGCREVRLEANTYGADVLGKNVRTANMKPGDLDIKDADIRR
ncbi:MAG: right-handed parallel beta-helix repeat-containing protein [Kiritimatiellaeota bacterium]|nr:right-handed parallel beta-helix repeat-containing protein [Kiritimatiellota bacterium]